MNLSVFKIISVYLIIQLAKNADCLTLDSDGGYSLFVSLKDVPIPPNYETFFNNFKDFMIKFSKSLWTSTNQTFYVKNVDLQIPSTWIVNDAETLPGIPSKIDLESSPTSFYHVENPNRCEKPGISFQVPWDFFTKTFQNENEQVNIFLKLWARYRWGVWEEHGFPSDPLFPYFYLHDGITLPPPTPIPSSEASTITSELTMTQTSTIETTTTQETTTEPTDSTTTIESSTESTTQDPITTTSEATQSTTDNYSESTTQTSTTFEFKIPTSTDTNEETTSTTEEILLKDSLNILPPEVTSCNMPKLLGDLKNIETGLGCDADPTQDPQCRFFPKEEESKETLSSIMSFHWLNSITSFCSEQTHDRESPNRQNTYCDKRSVLEVMRATEDFAKVTLPSSEPTDVAIRKLKFQTPRDDTPLLYILLDTGPTNIPPSVFNAIKQRLSRFVATRATATFGSLGIYPSEKNNGFHVDELISWKPVSFNQQEFLSAVNNYAPKSVNRKRDFGRALIEAGESMRKLNHPGGGVILIIKTGVAVGSFGQLAYENEVIGTLNEIGIRVFGIEVEFSGQFRPYVNLGYLTEVTEGLLYVIQSQDAQLEGMEYLYGNVTEALLVEVKRKHFLLYKRIIEPGTYINFFKIGDFSINTFDVTITADNPFWATMTEKHANQNIDIYEKFEWNVNYDAGSRFTNYGSWEVYNVGLEEFDFVFTCQDSIGKPCGLGLLTIWGSKPNMEPLNEEVQIKISTSMTNTAIGQEIHLYSTNNEEALNPAIYAKAAHSNGNQIRLTNGKIMASLLSLKDEGTKGKSEIFELFDNGVPPDIFTNDGIYSAFCPQGLNGSYKLFVLAQQSDLGLNSAKNLNVYTKSVGINLKNPSFILSSDQEEFGCGSNYIECTDEMQLHYSKAFDYPITLYFGDFPEEPPTTTIDPTSSSTTDFSTTGMTESSTVSQSTDTTTDFTGTTESTTTEVGGSTSTSTITSRTTPFTFPTITPESPRKKYWIEKPSGYLPVIGFCVVILLLAIGAGIYFNFKRRRANSPLKKRDKKKGESDIFGNARN